MRLILTFIIIFFGLSAYAIDPEVTYLESTGNNGGIRVFCVTTSVRDKEVVTADGKGKLKPEEQGCREVLNAILFDGVENYNDGLPLVANTNDAFARSLVNPKTKTFMSYCKEVTLENSADNKTAYHYIVVLNHYNLTKLLKMRGSIN